MTGSDPPVELDDLDESILSALATDGRAPFKEIARSLGVSDGTIRARFSRMVEAGLIRVAVLRNPFARDRCISALVGMELEKRTHRATMEQIASLPGVLSVANVTGGYDLVVELFLPSRDALNTFLFEQLAAVDGIRSTETFVLLDAINKWVPLPPGWQEHNGS